MLAPRALDVVCLGHAALDRVYTVDTIPAVATKVRATAFREVGGGMASNAACAIARLGGRVAFWGRAGDDAAGATIAREFATYGVDARDFRLLRGCRSRACATRAQCSPTCAGPPARARCSARRAMPASRACSTPTLRTPASST